MNRKKLRQKRIISLIMIAVLIGICVLIWTKMRWLLTDPDKLRTWVDGFGWKSRLVYIGLVSLQVIIAVIPGEPIELAAGYAFGGLEGTLIILAGVLLGSMAVFLLVRTAGLRLVKLFFEEEKIQKVRKLGSSKRSFLVWAICMIVPGTPKDLLTYCAGLTEIPLKSWVILFSVGRIPSIISSTFIGSAVGERSYLQAGLIFAVTALLCGIGLFLYARFSESEETKE